MSGDTASLPANEHLTALCRLFALGQVGLICCFGSCASVKKGFIRCYFKKILTDYLVHCVGTREQINNEKQTINVDYCLHLGFKHRYLPKNFTRAHHLCWCFDLPAHSERVTD